ncbi:uncharacterized protein LOC126368275 [Pectinophora gossypiella]|uniref:uncharacterized protein LOC126368275 n=1 Tax=Pectinophora gossypiella TaxID=13191 RepID=UPI00214EFA77|nr:uncharacterized protein LOC126368275 [Pectinophora gossypiella]
MWRAVQLGLILWCVEGARGIMCYNCSTTHEVSSACAGDFAPPYQPFNATRVLLANCTGENAMCFVRSWRARANHAWIVQRGCYHGTGPHDPVLRLLNKPTRAMTCTQRRLIEAEYKVCLCRSNWCNSAFSNDVSMSFLVYISILLYVNYLFNVICINESSQALRHISL